MAMGHYKAEEAVSRRYQAASWMQRMIGPLDLPSEPSEEDLRLSLRDGTVLCSLINKVNPGIVPKVQILESPDPCDNLGHSSYKHLENIRNFLTALEEMKLPVFEASDLEQGNFMPSSSERVVDCLLSLKSYCEWKQGRGSGLWKYDGTPNCNNSTRCSTREILSSPSNVATKSNGHLASSTPKNTYQPRKRWVIPEYENMGDAGMPVADDSSGLLLRHNGGSPQHMNGMHKSNGLTDTSADENYISSPVIMGTGLTSTHIHHISQKFREILRLKTKGTMQDLTGLENSAVLNSLENSSSQSLSSLVSAILGDKQQEEVPALVEFMLKKVMEEFERRLVTQSEQVVKLKNSLKEHLTREDRLASRARVLETLAAGTGEEVKIVSSQLQKMKMEKKQAEEEKKDKEALMEKMLKEKEERQMMVESLKKELDVVKRMDQEHFHQLELQKKELELELQAKLNDLEVLLEESQKRVQELEATSAAEMQILRKRNSQFQIFISAHHQSFQDIKRVSQATKREVMSMQGSWHKELEALEMQLHGLANAAAGYHKVLAENRQLYNEVQDLKGNIRVYCRVRPFLPGQTAKQSSVDFIGENGDISIVNPTKQGKDGHKMFCFNKIFGASATQEEVFLDTRPLIRSVLDGYNVCIFAYGQTGSGKTYTMSGPNSISQQDWGVNYRALNDLFQISQSRRDVFRYEVGVQMIEIYNEQVRDLLAIDGPNRRLEIRNNSQLNGLNVPDASMLPVNSTSDVVELMNIGQKNRAVGATALNERSSRSHSVLTVHVLGTDLASGSILRGCLHLVDLAGSERVDRSEATGDRLKEAQHINKSLSALGDVVSALAQKSAHVPYRNSKLTQLLQDSLGGQAKTLMFVHISPDLESYGETISTLKFAERVASVELGAARSNKESREMRELKEQISLLKDVVAKKDADIERLQAMRTSSAENFIVFEKTKAKFANATQSHRRTGEVQQRKTRRQTVDVVGNVEKRMAAPVFHDTPSHTFEAASPALSPREFRKPKPKEVLGKVRDMKIVSRNGSSHNRMADSDADVAQTNHTGKHDLAMEHEAVSKEWRERIQCSTDSSLFGTASLDDLPFSWDGVHVGKVDGEPSVPHSVAASPRYRSVLDKDSNFQSIKLRDSHSQDSSVTQSGTTLEPGEADLSRRNLYISDAMRNNLRIEIDRLQSREGDTASELSDGDISQAETESSLSSVVEQTGFIRKGDSKSEKINQGQRWKPPQVQLPRPSRGEWRSLNSGQTYPHARRHSTVVSTTVGAERSASKRQPSLGAKHVADGGISSFSSDGGLECSRQNLSGQVASKTAKRWL